MASSKDSLKLRPRMSQRWMGVVALAASAFFAAGAILAPAPDLSGPIVAIAGSLVFFYVGYSLLFSYVLANQRGLVIKDGLRSRHVDAQSVQDFELCNAGLYIAGQRTIGVRSATGVIALKVLARYPTRSGIRTLEFQREQLRFAVFNGSA